MIILGPPPQMGLEIYKNLPNNQAFVGTVYLQKMAEESRIAVVHFPYSDPDTIPTILPLHLRNSPWNLPQDFNAFLCQLLEVRKRELFSFVPIPIVRPKVRKINMNSLKRFKEKAQVGPNFIILLITYLDISKYCISFS